MSAANGSGGSGTGPGSAASRRRHAPLNGPGGPVTPITRHPKRRVALSDTHRRRLCEIAQLNPTMSHAQVARVLAEEEGIHVERSTVSRIVARSAIWLRGELRSPSTKRHARSRFPQVEEAVFELVRRKSRNPEVRRWLTDVRVSEFAKEAARLLGSGDFKASPSWLAAFKRRCFFISDRPDEDPESLYDIWQLERPEDMVSVLSNYDRFDDVYTMDATSLRFLAGPEDVAWTNPADEETAALPPVVGVPELNPQETSATVPNEDVMEPADVPSQDVASAAAAVTATPASLQNLIHSTPPFLPNPTRDEDPQLNVRAWIATAAARQLISTPGSAPTAAGPSGAGPSSRASGAEHAGQLGGNTALPGLAVSAPHGHPGNAGIGGVADSGMATSTGAVSIPGEGATVGASSSQAFGSSHAAAANGLAPSTAGLDVAGASAMGSQEGGIGGFGSVLPALNMAEASVSCAPVSSGDATDVAVVDPAEPNAGRSRPDTSSGHQEGETGDRTVDELVPDVPRTQRQLAVILCVNGSASHRVEPWVIGSQAISGPRDYPDRPFPGIDAHYRANRTGTITASILRDWLMWLDSKLDRSVLLVSSLFTQSDLDAVSLQWITVLPVPPWTGASRRQGGRCHIGEQPSGVYTPMDDTLMEWFRVRYRQSYVERMLRRIQKGRYLVPVSLRDATEMIQAAWRSLRPSMVKQAFRASEVCPPALLQRSRSASSSSRADQQEQSIRLMHKDLEEALYEYAASVRTYMFAESLGLNGPNVPPVWGINPGRYVRLRCERPVLAESASDPEIVASVMGPLCTDGETGSGSFERPPDSGNGGSTANTRSRSDCQGGTTRIEDLEVKSRRDMLLVLEKLMAFVRSDSELHNEEFVYLVSALVLKLERIEEAPQ